MSDLGGRTIRHVATDGSVTTPYGQDNVAVYADGNGTAATFEAPGPLVRVGQKLYVTDQVALRQIDLVSGDVTLVLGDPANLATSGYVDGSRKRSGCWAGRCWSRRTRVPQGKVYQAPSPLL